MIVPAYLAGLLGQVELLAVMLAMIGGSGLSVQSYYHANHSGIKLAQHPHSNPIKPNVHERKLNRTFRVDHEIFDRLIATGAFAPFGANGGIISLIASQVSRFESRILIHFPLSHTKSTTIHCQHAQYCDQQMRESKFTIVQRCGVVGRNLEAKEESNDCHKHALFCKQSHNSHLVQKEVFSQVRLSHLQYRGTARNVTLNPAGSMMPRSSCAKIARKNKAARGNCNACLRYGEPIVQERCDIPTT